MHFSTDVYIPVQTKQLKQADVDKAFFMNAPKDEDAAEKESAE